MLSRIEAFRHSTYQLPQEGNIPVFRGNQHNSVGFALVDTAFQPLIAALGPWYIGDQRLPSPPRISFRIHKTRQVNITLARCVATIFYYHKSRKLEAVETSLTREQLYELSRELPKIGFVDTMKPFDCRISNLHLGFRPPSELPASALQVPDEQEKLTSLTEVSREELDKIFSGETFEGLQSKASLDAIEPKGSDEIADLRSLLRADGQDNSPIAKP
jgi:hypothetical protein